MLHAWQELNIFNEDVLGAIRSAIRSSGDAHAHLLDEATLGDDDEDLAGVEVLEAGAPGGIPTVQVGDHSVSSPKKRRVDDIGSNNADSREVAEVEATAPLAKPKSERIQAIVDRLLAVPADQ